MHLSGKLAIFILASLVSLHHYIYKYRVKLAAFEISKATPTSKNGEN